MQITVIGIGNSLASDEGVGPEVVRSLQREYTLSGLSPLASAAFSVNTPNFLTAAQVDKSLLDVIKQCEILILVDAVVSGAKPGTLHYEAWDTMGLNTHTVERISSHGLNTPEILYRTADLDRLPDQILLWGIEVATTKAGRGLSPKLAAALPAITIKLYWELQKICQYPEDLEKILVAEPAFAP